MLRTLKKIIIQRFGMRVYEQVRLLADNFLDYSHTSYSQYGEDMILRHIFAEKKNGFFVDVGAFHPKQFSNTYYLYKRGWRGINIEPRPHSVNLFNRLRPRDINREVAVSSSEESRMLYHWGTHAENTLHPPLADTLAKRLGVEPHIVSVLAQPLRQILAEHVPPATTIDLLTVDAEGVDFEVLQSNDWNVWKPTVILVEILFTSAVDDVFHTPTHCFLTSLGYTLTHALTPTFIYQIK